MSDYTPTTAEHRRLIEDAYGGIAATAFDRWLAAHDHEVAAKAWDEGARFDPDPASRKNPYRKDTE